MCSSGCSFLFRVLSLLSLSTKQETCGGVPASRSYSGRWASAAGPWQGRNTGPTGADGRCASAICVGSMIVARCRSRNIGAGNRPAHDRCAGRPSEPGLGRRRPQENSTMSDTQVAALDHTVQQTNVWLKRLGEELHIDDRHVAYSALRAVLHVLREGPSDRGAGGASGSATAAPGAGALLRRLAPDRQTGQRTPAGRVCGSGGGRDASAVRARRFARDQGRFRPAGAGARLRRSRQGHRDSPRSAAQLVARQGGLMERTMPIDVTEFGSITIEGKTYDHDVIVRLSGKVEKRRKRLSKAQYGTS